MEFSECVYKNQLNTVQTLPNQYWKSVSVLPRIYNDVVRIKTRIRAGCLRIRFSIPGSWKRFILLQTSRPTLNPTLSPIQWVLGFLSVVQSVWGMKPTYSIHLTRRLRMTVTIHSQPAHPFMPYRQFYLTLIFSAFNFQVFKKGLVSSDFLMKYLSGLDHLFHAL